ncbi:MAG: methyltransferase [Cyclobacteriaceae bacterium]|nr:methyltransferase [Cyclobacteriaceae bacterium]
MDDVFYFKQFSIRQRHSAMKAGTDGVLLGTWVNLKHVNSILDVGTGTGLIALMLAQRTDGKVKIDALEIEEGALADAQENFEASPWKEKLHLHAQSIRDFHPSYHYDLIVSNPPYFIKALKSPNQKRNTARHSENHFHDELIRFASGHLTTSGRLAVILPPETGTLFRKGAVASGLFPSRFTAFKSRKEKPVSRWLMEFSRQIEPEVKSELILYEDGLNWTDDYRKLVSDFYLNG